MKGKYISSFRHSCELLTNYKLIASLLRLSVVSSFGRQVKIEALFTPTCGLRSLASRFQKEAATNTMLSRKNTSRQILLMARRSASRLLGALKTLALLRIIWILCSPTRWLSRMSTTVPSLWPPTPKPGISCGNI